MNTNELTKPFDFGEGKRYYTMNSMLRRRFGCKVIKIPLNAGLTCPNIDGTAGRGGCGYCSEGSGAFAGSPLKSLAEQFEDGKALVSKKWREGLYIPYFQAHTNTYCTPRKLRSMLEEAEGLPDICGISLSTRPDCIDEEKADILAEFAERLYLTVELGLQTVHDETALKLNRCCTYEDFLKGFEILNARGINICVHIIDGLPGESVEMMAETARELSKLDIHGIKIHVLHIIKGTRMAAEYEQGLFELPTMEEYVNTVCSQIELLPPGVCIERVTGDGAAAELIAPMWTRRKIAVINNIDKELRRRDTYQGIYYPDSR